MIEIDIHNASAAGIEWLKRQNPVTVKDLSRSIQALSLWKENTAYLIEILLSLKKGAFWETDKTLLDTARACIALAGCGIIQSDAIKWIQEQQEKDNWNNNEIDTSYALIALGDAGIKNEAGCEWLVNNYGDKWEHVGTTSLIITALQKQNESQYGFFINDRAGWILSKRLFGGWTHIATSNLAIQALILAGERDIEKEIGPSIKWLLEKQNRGNWGDITSTSLSLISLGMYLDCLESSKRIK
ncbi:MAG: hypothetical protein O8C66_14980 [Candidatus Methanoperedens sp.]|nr:hypothetical protein [Candidatus Methanoperedens sp.]